jgi:hypothetical protein
MTAQLRFGTLVTCIDGRVQRPTILWMRERYGLDYVDVISAPGPDKLLAAGDSDEAALVRRNVGFSIAAHDSRLVALCGHHDCAGNPATDDEHRGQICRGTALLRSWGLGADTVGLWLDEGWAVEIVVPPLAQG